MMFWFLVKRSLHECVSLSLGNKKDESWIIWTLNILSPHISWVMNGLFISEQPPKYTHPTFSCSLWLCYEHPFVPLPALAPSTFRYQRALTVPSIICKFSRVNMPRCPPKRPATMHSVIGIGARKNIPILPSASAIPTLDAAKVHTIMDGSIGIRARTLTFFLTVFVLAHIPASHQC